jgi:dolichol-phosphate mannosyltransferase
MNPTLTVFIPAYNEAVFLERCVKTLREKLEALNVAAELLIVDDGSQDGTGPLADDLADRYSNLRVIHHDSNRGMGAAFLSAVAAAWGEWLILIPADLAMNPDDLYLYLDGMAQADVVVGLRTDRSDYSWIRRLISWTNIRLIQTLFGMRERQFQYISMYRIEVLRKIEIKYWRSAFFLAEILIKAKALGYRLVEVEIRYLPRQTGRATGTTPALVLMTVRDILHFYWVSHRK